MATNEHPIKKKLDHPTIYDRYANRERVTKPFHIRAMNAAATLDIDYQKIRQFCPSLHPPWMLNQKRFDTEMLKYASNENSYVKKSAFRELVDREYRYYQHINGLLEMDGKTGYAVVTPNETLKVRLPDEASAYTTELSAISH
jgi:hypothetical protein